MYEFPMLAIAESCWRDNDRRDWIRQKFPKGVHMGYYSKLTKAQEQVFWHKQRDSVGVAVTARDRQAVKAGKKVSVQQRSPVKQRRPSS